MTCDDVERLIEAYADGELELERAVDLETHLAGCEACTARLERTRALANTIQAAPYFRAPRGLADRVARRSPRRWRPWIAVAASLALVSVAAVTVVYERTVMTDRMTTESVIEGHVRSLMAGHLTDVASTDRHTVKPWFAGRVDFSPTVVDLVSDGYPLVGGRLDYIDHHAAAALVYKRREHAINVFIWPQTDGSASRVTRSDARGYHVISWTRGGVAVWIVSDVALEELTDFAQRLDGAM